MENNKIKFRSSSEIHSFKLKLYCRQNKQLQRVIWLCKISSGSCRSLVCWEPARAMLDQHRISFFSDKKIFMYLCHFCRCRWLKTSSGITTEVAQPLRWPLDRLRHQRDTQHPRDLPSSFFLSSNCCSVVMDEIVCALALKPWSLTGRFSWNFSTNNNQFAKWKVSEICPCLTLWSFHHPAGSPCQHHWSR